MAVLCARPTVPLPSPPGGFGAPCEEYDEHMFRLWLVIGFLATVFYIYSIVNVGLTDRLGVRGLPKIAWILVVVVFPLIGAILWYAVGRSGLRGGRVLAPDDDPDFLATLGNNSKHDDNGTDG